VAYLHPQTRVLAGGWLLDLWDWWMAVNLWRLDGNISELQSIAAI
jgi:hypothetical protein